MHSHSFMPDLLKYWRAKYFLGYKEIIGISQDETFILLGIKFILQINPFVLSQRFQIKFPNQHKCKVKLECAMLDCH